MNRAINSLKFLQCLDSDEMASSRRRELDIDRRRAADLGVSSIHATRIGYYNNRAGEEVDWSSQVERARLRKISFAPEAKLPPPPAKPVYSETKIQVANETTLQAALRLVAAGHNPMALNFANGVVPGGGFLDGSRAQEEVLCRSSALHCTLDGDPMYDYHRGRLLPDSTDWVIYSPDVPVFRSDDGLELDRPWLLSFLTSAAPYAPTVGKLASMELLKRRIRRVLSVASATGYQALVLGAWGCGAFGNDPLQTATDFREALENDFCGQFSDIIFAVTDWSPDRKYLGPFRDVFS